jgi:arginyl-tRNA--protein-N-Asp/Glu arginylyltransferase
MYAQVVQPSTLSPSELDQYLEKGFFRLGSRLFTTSFLTFEESIFDAFWLRIDLEQFEFSRSQKDLLKRASRFRVAIEPFLYSYEAEDLFQLYRESLTFQPAKTLEHILGEDPDVFRTMALRIYDGKKCIACGLFDLGENATQGIVSFYDPSYKKFSLGKVLMLHKIQYVQGLGQRWFYPGYVAPGYPRFDYKLEVGKAYSSYYDLRLGRWMNIEELDLKTQPLSKMLSALVQVEGLLHTMGYVDFHLKKYRFYDITLDAAYTEYGLITYPFFIHCFANSPMEEVVIVYDTLTEKFQLLLCSRVFQITFPDDKPEYYSTFLLRPHYVVFEDAQELNFVFALNELLGRASKAEKIT